MRHKNMKYWKHSSLFFRRNSSLKLFNCNLLIRSIVVTSLRVPEVALIKFDHSFLLPRSSLSNSPLD